MSQELINNEEQAIPAKAAPTEKELRRARQRRGVRFLWRVFGFGMFTAFLFLAYLRVFELPSFQELENPKSSVASEVFAGDGSSLGRYFLENRVPVRYDQLPRHLIDALICTEDERFQEHSGIDAEALGRVAKGIVNGTDAGGGSTISQQLAKLLFDRPSTKGMNPLSKAFSMVKIKFKEWIVAVQLERNYTKEEIMTMYLNKFNFINGAYGVKTACEVYFGKIPQELKIEESAMLIGMLKNPVLYNPRRFYDRAMKRREVVLDQMRKHGKINRSQYDSLRVLPIDLSRFSTRDVTDGAAPYFRDEVRREVARILEDVKKPDGTKYDIYTDGLKIYTTLNPKIQKYAEEALTEHFKQMQRLIFAHWRGRDPWVYRQDGVDGAEIQMRLAEFQKQVFNSDRYQAIRGRTVKKMNEMELRDADMVRLEEIQKKGRRLIDDWLKTKFINQELATRYREALEPTNWGALKAEWDKLQKAVQENFSKPVEMKIFDYTSNWEADSIMTPYDSVRYHRMILQAGVMAVDPHTGYVQAWVGGPSYKWFKYDHVNQGAARQVGSTFKPYIYAMSIQERGYSPCFTVRDAPVVFQRGEFGLPAPWRPDNAGGGFSGASFTLYDALQYSKNSVSAYLMKDLGDTKPLRSFIARMGIDTSRVPAKPAICLGACEISVFEMAAAYSTFANDGIYAKPIFITKIEDKNGNVLFEAVSEQTRVLTQDANYVMTKMLEYVAEASPELTNLKSTVGGKTGTTNYAADCWYMGLTPNLVVGTWTGCDDRWIRFRDLTWGQGGKQARPIFVKLMQKLEKDPLSGYVVVDTGFAKPARELEIETDCRKYHQSTMPAIFLEQLVAAKQAAAAAGIDPNTITKTDGGETAPKPKPKPAPGPANDEGTHNDALKPQGGNLGDEFGN